MHQGGARGGGLLQGYRGERLQGSAARQLAPEPGQELGAGEEEVTLLDNFVG